MNLADKYMRDAADLAVPVEGTARGKVAWRSPSNIALIKYWGKKPQQIPANPSLSFTLRNSCTDTSVEYALRDPSEAQVRFLFEGKENPAFGERVKRYLGAVTPFLPFLGSLDLAISSSNSFPHSSGIASSASAMSALALCLVGIERDLFGSPAGEEDFLQKAAFLARLGSGSATRSVYGGFAVWGQTPVVGGSSDEAGTPFKLPEGNSMLDIRDAILITSTGKKEVSSSHGHGLMDRHPWADARYRQAGNNLEGLLHAILNEKDEEIIGIIENEALSLHALMMSSPGGYRLMNERTWNIIDRVRRFRASSGIFIAFTLDAGPNVHLLYKNRDRDRVLGVIREELLGYCDNGYWIDDGVGQGPAPLKEE